MSASRRSIIRLILRLRQIIDLLATDKSRYFAEPRPIIVNYLLLYLAGVEEKPRKVIINDRMIWISLGFYASPEPKLALTSRLGQNVGLGKG